MSSELLALPVSQGDAFYLRRDDVSILIDGGKSIQSFPSLLKTHVSPTHLDIVVCTHNDADHANGIIGLLEDCSFDIKEVWVPGTWTWRLRDLTCNPLKFLEELYSNLHQFDGFEGSTLESVFSRYKKSQENYPSDEAMSGEHEADNSKWFEDNYDLDNGVSDPFLDWFNVMYCDMYRFPFCRLWLECLNAAFRIRKIIENAFNAGVRIRLFEFVNRPNPIGNKYKELYPVNSHEVYPHSARINAMDWLALTTNNRESLVFYAPENLSKSFPAALFTADSDLHFGLSHLPTPTNGSVIITAPHHGSEENTSAYPIVANWLNSLEHVWVRSDSRSKNRPGSTFKSQQRRVCTLCNPPIYPKRVLKFYEQHGVWQHAHNTQWCSCK